MDLNFKEGVIERCFTILLQKEEAVKAEISQLRDAIANDSKSSMGDKYETSREMSQQEINRLEQQQSIIKQQIFQLKAAPLSNKTQNVSLGSLIETSIGYFYIATALGEINLNNQAVYVISPAAPLAKSLINQTKGKSIVVNNKQITITDFI